jgi:hypothetical protein
MQLAHCNFHFFITAIAYHTWFYFTKSASASGICRRSTIARRRTSGSRSTSRSAINIHGAREEVESQVQIEEVTEVHQNTSHRTP